MLKTHNIKWMFVVCLSLALFTSCKKDFLDLKPPTSLTPEQALALEADLQVALRGAYAGLRATDYYGRTVPVLGDLLADNTYQSLNNTNRYTQFNNYSFNAPDGNVEGFWDAAYRTILRANNIINSPIPANANVNQYKGEAYAIRALSYFTLIRYFARPYTDNPSALGVPIVLEYDPNAMPARSTVAEVYARIIEDLNQAYTLMTQFTNSSQFSKYAARGLQAKVYLTMGDKTNAKTAALDVINNSGFTVVSAANHASYWAGLLPRTDKVETLFEVSSDANSNNGFDALANIYNQGGYGDLLMNPELYALYEAGDVRKALYPVVKRSGVDVVAANNKYPGTFAGDMSDTKVLRMAEMYLIAAEASLPGNETDALTYLNYLVTRRGGTAIAATGDALFEAIITERRKELAFEGDRYLDLQRLKRDVVRDEVEYPAAARMIPYNNTRRILPIPQAEIDVNANIRTQQNPGY